MKNLEAETDELDLSSSGAPILIKLAFLSTRRRDLPLWFGILCFFIFNLQTLALLLKNAYMFMKDDFIGSSLIKNCFQFFTFTDWFSFENAGLTLLAGFLILLYILHILFLAAQICIKLYIKKPLLHSVQVYWNIICIVHPLVFYFPVHTWNLQVLKYIHEEDSPSFHIGFVAVFYFNLAFNFFLMFIMTRLFNVIIKSKDPLCAKNYHIRSKDLFTKTVMPILWLYVADQEWLQTAMLVIAFVDCLFRDLMLFYYLPFYSIRILEARAAMQGVFTSFALTAVITRIFYYTKFETGIYFLIAVSFLLAPVAVKIYNIYLWRMLNKVISKSGKKMNLYYKIHKKYVISHIMKKRVVPHNHTKVFDKNHFFFQAKLSHLSHKYRVDSERVDYERELFKKMMKNILGKTIKEHPRSHIAKVAMAHFHVMYENAFLLANNLIEEVMKDSPRFEVRVTMFEIRMELQRKLQLQYSTHTSDPDDQSTGLNIMDYVQTNQANEELKMRMRKQVQTQLNFWENFLSPTPEMGELVAMATEVQDLKVNVEKAWRQLIRVRAATFLSPPLVYGMYLSLVNNNTPQGEKFLEQYHKEFQIHKQALEAEQLNHDTLMGEDIVQISMSGLRKKMGRVMDCSANVQDAFGWKKEFLVGRPVIILMSPFFKQKHDSFLINHYNTGKTKVMNKTMLTPVLGNEGYLHPTWMHIKINPIVEFGISYISIIKPINNFQRLVLVRKNGAIDAMSKNFAKDMNMLPSQKDSFVKIFNFCPSFKEVNFAFNMIAARSIRETTITTILEKRQENFSSDQSSAESLNFGKISEKNLELYDDEEFLNNFRENLEGRTPKGRTVADTQLHITRKESKAQEVYERFLYGAKIAFFPQRQFSITGNKIQLFGHDQSNESQPVIYNVKITNRVYGKEFLKFLLMERLDNDDPEVQQFLRETNPNSKLIASSPVGTWSKYEDEQTTRSRKQYFDFSSPHSSDSRAAHSAIQSQFELFKNQSQLEIFRNPSGAELMVHQSHKTASRTDVNFNQSHRNQSRTEIQPHIPSYRPMPSPQHVEPLFSPMSNATVRHLILKKQQVTEEKDTESCPTISDEMHTHENVQQNIKPYKKRVTLLINNGTGLSLPGQNDELSEQNFSSRHAQVMAHQVSGLGLGPMKRHPTQTSIHTANFGNKPNQPNEYATVLQNIIDQQSTDNPMHNSAEEHHEANLLKKKFRKLRERLNRGILEAAQVEHSIASSYLSKGKKVQNLVSQALNMQVLKKQAIIFGVSFILFIIGVVILQIIQAVTTFSAINDLKEDTYIIETGVYRMNTMVSLARSSRLWTIITQGLSSPTAFQNSAPFFYNNLIIYTTKLNGYDSLLRTQVAGKDQDLQDLFYGRATNVIDKTLTNETVIVQKSNFEAVSQIVDRGFRLIGLGQYDPLVPYTGYEYMYYIIQNGFGDVLSTSESSVLGLFADLQSVISGIRVKMLGIYAATMAFAAIFLVCSIRHFFIIRSRAHLFMVMFFRLSTQEAEETKSLLGNFLNTIDGNIKNSDLLEDQKDVLVKNKTNAKMQFRKASMKKLYLHQFSQFLKLLPFYLLLNALVLGYLLLSYDAINRIKKEELQIETSLKNVYIVNLQTAEFVEFILGNATSTTRNKPIEEDLKDLLEQTKSMDSIFSSFTEDGDELTEEQRQVFFEFPCENFANYNVDPVAQVIVSCEAISQGRKQIGLMEAGNELYRRTKVLFDLFITSDRDMTSLVNFLQLTLANIQNYGITTTPLCQVLYEITSKKYHDRIDNIRLQAVIFTLCISVVFVFGSLVFWVKVIRKIFEYESTDRVVLQMVPIKIILGNRHLKQYIFQKSDGMLDRIDRFM